MPKKIMIKMFALTALLLTAYFANAQQTERLPVVATPEEKLLNMQKEKQSKSEKPVSQTPWLLCIPPAKYIFFKKYIADNFALTYNCGVKVL